MSLSDDSFASSADLASMMNHHDGNGWFEPVPGEALRVRVDSKAVGGRLTIIEGIAQSGFSTSLHHHPEDEIFHVLEGHVTFQIGAERMTGRPGTIIFVPAGIHHAWGNFSSAPIHMTATFTPGGVEAFFEQAPGLSADERAELARRFGMVIVGPPIDGDRV